MVKIKVAKEIREYIKEYHKAYIEQTSVIKLEEKIKNKDKRSKFLKTLFGGTEQRRKDRIVNFCLSDDLEDLLEKFEIAFENVYGFDYIYRSDYAGDREEYKNIIENTRDDLNYILDYDGFNKGKTLTNGKKWNRHCFITSLKIKVCPYCNRQYITSYEDGENKTTADADHYYAKAKYPILQMNIYNLVPSCNVCNSRMKGKNEKKHLYPYRDASDSLTFFIPTEMGEKVSKILINTKKNKRAEASVEVFKLDKIYQAHLEEASEIKENVKQYYEFKENVYEATYGLKIPFNVYNMWFGFMGKDMSAEPLIKLKQDIFKQLEDEINK